MFKFKKKQTKIIVSLIVVLLISYGIFKQVGNYTYQFVILCGGAMMLIDIWAKKAEGKE